MVTVELVERGAGRDTQLVERARRVAEQVAMRAIETKIVELTEGIEVLSEAWSIHKLALERQTDDG